MPADLAAHRCIHYRNPARGALFTWEFARPKETLLMPVTGALTVNDVVTLIPACVSAGGHGPGDGTRAMIESGSLVELFPDWPDETFPLYAPPAVLSAAAKDAGDREIRRRGRAGECLTVAPGLAT